MKKLYSLLTMLIFVATINLNAQMTNGSISPDFTATDINGVEHNLYDLLDQGKSVILDIAATWCGPCWSYHNEGTLKTVWEQYGPDGTDQVYVFMIEGDNSTTMADLEGTGDNTKGDWITGTDYPIIDDGNLSSLFQITSFPTIYHICPNRTITSIGQTSLSNFYDTTMGCQLANGSNNISIISADLPEGSFCGSLGSIPKVKFNNMGMTNNLTTADFVLSINGNVEQTINWTGDLGIYDIANLSFNPITFSADADISISIENVNGGTDSDMSNNTATSNLSIAPSTNDMTVTVEIMTDDFGYETYWELRDDSGTVYGSGGNDIVIAGGQQGGGTLQANDSFYENATLYQEEITLPEGGCYEMYVADDWGDGMCCLEGNGYYKVTDISGNVLFQNGEFESDKEEAFEIGNSVAVKTLDVVEAINIFPNPVIDQLTLHFNLVKTTEMNVTIYNTLGQVVNQSTSIIYLAGENQIYINTSTLENGVYFIAMNNTNKTLTKKFTVNR